ncbi:GntR family transcriptional regulator [Crossiella sp. SN42]|uniref:GntR family transcriptional regulator n=1 Tax=Crossiella sp. SN42 TaxID=2944808 RepID=UPI00207D321E|nr:GntR family transcriptional regulator [Crossiella sp. SN42]MCO1582405.1 GntR family transcriptional regulator [Crossiella sp. SN42]
MGKLDPNDSRAPYIQVASDLRDAIARGQFAPGAQLPSHQAVADEYGVSVGTVKSAFGVLRQHAVIVSRQGVGAFVRTDLDVSSVGELDLTASGEQPVTMRDLQDLRDSVAQLAEQLATVEKRLSANGF